MSYPVVLTAAYLMGSFPTGFVLARARGVDIRKTGSGNIGATNVLRTLGRTAGVCVLVVDFLKGLLACLLLPLLIKVLFPDTVARSPHAAEAFEVLAGIGAVLGHNYTCWLHFKGGKGIATSAGVLVAWVPKALPIVLPVWLISFLLFRYVSLSSMLAAVTLPLAVWITGGTVTMITLTAALAILAILKHKTNIRRLLAGTEHRVTFRRTQPDS
jgi:glycerol-3-phosphate acyltransferase PlsY